MGEAYRVPNVRIGGYRVTLASPKVSPDEWLDEAACSGQCTTEIDPVAYCATCPVVAKCEALWRGLDEAIKAEYPWGHLGVPGIWAGERKKAEPKQGSNSGRPRTNIGPCNVDGCERVATTMHMCNAHYCAARKKT